MLTSVLNEGEASDMQAENKRALISPCETAGEQMFHGELTMVRDAMLSIINVDSVVGKLRDGLKDEASFMG